MKPAERDESMWKGLRKMLFTKSVSIDVEELTPNPFITPEEALKKAKRRIARYNRLRATAIADYSAYLKMERQKIEKARRRHKLKMNGRLDVIRN